jgi:hypothetical protein
MNLILREVIEKELTSHDGDQILVLLRKYYDNYANNFKISKKIISEKIINGTSIYDLVMNSHHTQRVFYLSSLAKISKLESTFNTNNGHDLELNDYIYHVNDSEVDLDIGLAHVFFTILQNENAACMEIAENTLEVYDKKISAIDINSANFGPVCAKFLDFFKFNSVFDFVKKTNLNSISSWTETLNFIRDHTSEIILADDCFTGMNRYPFNVAVSNQIIRIINQLDQLSLNIASDGKMNEAAQEIYRTHFTRKGGDYSSESTEYKPDLNFNNECLKDADCTWHGKIESEHDPIRIHFTWPKIKDKPIIIAYVGQKRTKK